MSCSSVGDLAEAYYEYIRTLSPTPLAQEHLERLRKICVDGSIFFHRAFATRSEELRRARAVDIRTHIIKNNERVPEDRQRRVPSEDWLPPLREESQGAVMTHAYACALTKMQRECERAGLPLVLTQHK
jgi:hypothetical protein